MAVQCSVCSVLHTTKQPCFWRSPDQACSVYVCFSGRERLRRFCSIPSIPAVAVVHSFSDSSQPGSPGSPFPLGRNIKEGSQTACGRDAFRARACDMGQAGTLPHSLDIASYLGDKCNFQRYLGSPAVSMTRVNFRPGSTAKSREIDGPSPGQAVWIIETAGEPIFGTFLQR